MVEKYTTVDRIINRIGRGIPEEFINENDVIEYTGEVLEHLKNFHNQQQVVTILKVSNYEADMPDYLTAILQIAKVNKEIREEQKCATEDKEDFEVFIPSPIDKCDECLDCEKLQDWIYDLKDSIDRNEYMRFDIPYIKFVEFYKKDLITPIRLSNHSFFNNIVCEEKYKIYCPTCQDEYSIVGTLDKKLRFSFQDGWVALSYLKSAIDEETGYPLIPDEENCLSAISYYIRWKIAERLSWDKPNIYLRISQDSERLYYKYIKQAKNYFKMPKYIDQYQNLLEETHNMIPDKNKYYGFFGNLSKKQLYNV